MKEIAERIKKIRLERGMTQQDLADALGLKSRSSINKIEMDAYEIGLDLELLKSKQRKDRIKMR